VLKDVIHQSNDGRGRSGGFERPVVPRIRVERREVLDQLGQLPLVRRADSVGYREDVLVRAAQLSGTARELAELAAVIGTRTSYELLDQVGGLDRGQLEDALEELQRHQILVEDEVDQVVVYDFSHPLIRETIKSELSLARRRTLHGHVAESLENLYAHVVGAHAAELVYHFLRAHRDTAGERAVRYLALAGKDALSRHANHEAAKHLREALGRIEVIGDGAGREYIDQNVNVRDVVTGLAKAETRLGNYEASIELWRRELEAARAVDDQHRVARVHRELGLTLFWGARLEEAQEEFQEGVKAARTSGNDLTIAYINLAASLCYQQTGQIPEARNAIEEALELAKKHNNVPLLARVHTSLARLHLWQGEHDLVRPNSETAIELATECDDPGVVFWGHWAIGVMEGMRGNLSEIPRRLRKMSRIVEALNSPILRLWSAELSIEHAYCYGDWDTGIELGESAVDLARSLHQNTLLPRLLVWLSLIYIGRGDFERVKELTDEAWEVSGAGRTNEKFVDVHTVVPAHIGRAAYHLAMNEWDETIRIGERGLAIANRSGYGMWSIHRLLPMVGEAHFHCRNLEPAKRIAARIRHLSEPLGHRLGLAWADGLDAITVWLEGDIVRGADLLRQASDALDAIPMRLDAARLRRQLAGRLADLDDREGALGELRAVHATFEWLGCARELENTRGQVAELGAEPPALHR